MVANKGNSVNKRIPSKPLRYFFIEGKPYKALRRVRAADLLVAWSYEDRCKVNFINSEVRKRHQKAWTTSDVQRFLSSGRTKIQEAINEDYIPAPYKIESLAGTGKKWKYLWTEKDIFRLHDYFLTIHRGRPRKDGQTTTESKIPTRAELRARMNDEVSYFVQDSAGNFVKVWKEPEW